jgi:hypothetical protein
MKDAQLLVGIVNSNLPVFMLILYRMSRFNVRAIGAAPPPPAPYVPVGKSPSAYRVMTGGTVSEPTPVVSTTKDEPKKKGRPKKEDLRKEALMNSAEHVRTLMSGKHTKAKVMEYFEGRIAFLNAEKA